MTTKAFSLLALVGLGLSSVIFSGCPAPIQTMAALKTAFEAAAQDYQTPGAVLLVRSPCGLQCSMSTGLANIERQEAMRPDLFFRIGSVTKSFTATAILILADRGLLNLDDTVESWVPGWVPLGERISVRMLLRMRSGLAEYYASPAFMELLEANPQRAWTNQELIRYVVTESEPDSCFAYRNANYVLLGEIIERASQQSYAQFLREEIFIPLALDHTSVPSDLAMPEPYARGYAVEEGLLVDATQSLHPSMVGAAGNIVSTAEDTLHWAQALFAGTLLSPESHQAMFELIPAELSESELHYGFGVARLNGALGHNGSYNILHTTAMFRYAGYDFVLLVNGEIEGTSGIADDLFFAILHDVFGNPPLISAEESAAKALSLPF